MKRLVTGLTLALAILFLFFSCKEIVGILGLNNGPVANAGPDQVVDFGEEVTLDGSASFDEDGDSLTYSWTLSAYESGSALRNDDIGASSTQRAFVTPDVPGVFIFTLTVTDEYDESSSDDVQITVNEQVAPATPTGLNISATSDTSLTVSWNASEGAESYTLYRDSDENGLFNDAVYLGTNTSRLDAGLPTGVTFWYKVKASNAAGESDLSIAVAGTTGAAVDAPATPTGLETTSVSASAIALAWDIVSGAARYQVERSTDDISFSEVYDDAANTFTDYSVSGGTTYYYRVTASNSGGTSGPSASIEVSTGLSVPTGLEVGLPTQTSLTISWNDVGAPAYTLARSTDNVTFAEISTDATSPYVDTPISNGTQYFYKVKSTNVGSESVYTAAKSGLTKPATPSAPTAGDATESSLTVSWGAVYGAESYTVYTDTTSAGTFADVVETTTGLVVIAFGLDPATPYNFQVRAWNPSGFSDYSATGSGTTLAAATVVPDQPVGLMVLEETSDSITITWNPAANAARYEVFSDSAGSFSSVGETGALWFTEDGLDAETTYTYYVVAWNSQGPSADSASIAGTTLIGVPGIPGAPTVSNPTDTTLDVLWTAVPGADNYTLHRSTDNITYTDLLLGIPGTTHTDTSLNPGTTYFYRVQAFNEGGPSDLSSFGIGTTTSNLIIPTNVMVTGATVSTLTVSWDTTGTADEYLVFRDNFETGDFIYVAYQGTDTSFVDDNLPSGTEFFYMVKAVEGAALSGFSDMAWGITLEEVPATPTGLSVGGATPTSLYISWVLVEGADNYRLTYSDDILVYFGPNRFFVDEELNPSTVYAYKVRAENLAGDSPYSPTVPGETLSALLEPPVTVDAMALSNTSIEVTWSGVDGALFYKIYRQREDSVFGFLTDVPAVATSYVDENLPSGTTFNYRIKTGGESGDSAYSDWASATTLGPQQPNYIGVSPDSYAVNVDWGWSDGADGYYLYRSEFESGPFVKLGPFMDTWTEDRGLNADTDYFYKATAFIGVEESTFSPTKMAHTDMPPMSPPFQPFFWDDYKTSHSIYLKWDPEWDVRSYRLFIADTGTGPWDIPIFEGSDTKFLVEGLEPGTEYWFLLIAENDAGDSGLDNVQSILTNMLPTAPPGMPMIWGGVDDWDYRVDVSWDWISDTEFYILERSTDEGATWGEIFSGPNTGFEDRNMEPGIYMYRVAAANAMGTSSWSAPLLTVEVSGTGEVIIIVQ